MENENITNKERLKQKSRDIRVLYLNGKITRDEAKKELKDFIKYYNETAKKLAKKYDMKPYKFCFASFMR